MTKNTLIALYNEQAVDLPAALKFVESQSCDMVITPIVNQLFHREFILPRIAQKHLRFTRSDLSLEASDWLTKVIGKLSDKVMGCDSPDTNVRKNSEATLRQELAFAHHCISNAYTMIRLRDTNTINLARTINAELQGTMLIEVPMVDPKLAAMDLRADPKAEEYVAEDPWRWWNTFRAYAGYKSHYFVALEMSADLPSTEELLRWTGEPVQMLVIPSDIFITNAKNYPVLTKAHKSVLFQFLKYNVNLALKANASDVTHLRNCIEYLKFIVSEHDRTFDEFQRNEDILQIPLQPLYNNLDTYTYEIFEKDPVKYIFYQHAIEQALRDKIPDDEIETKTAIIMVVGAGRGPLVRSTINASKNTKRKIHIFVIEKNPNAIVTLQALREELWSEENITIISSDMRDFKPTEMGDILVSELLGSFGDNELSPECLDGAQKHLKPDGISIPSRSTSYLNPVMSPKLMNIIRDVRSHTYRGEIPQPSHEIQSESTYVVYLKNAYHIAAPKPVFTFDHPNRDAVIDNSRYTTLSFDVRQDCLLTGFAGYFDTVLYKDIMLSIHPETHSDGLSSWFPMYFPLAEPQQVCAGQTITVNVWRCVSSNKVWYEWNTSAPIISHIHNANGLACPIYK